MRPRTVHVADDNNVPYNELNMQAVTVKHWVDHVEQLNPELLDGDLIPPGHSLSRCHSSGSTVPA